MSKELLELSIPEIKDFMKSKCFVEDQDFHKIVINLLLVIAENGCTVKAPTPKKTVQKKTQTKSRTKKWMRQ